MDPAIENFTVEKLEAKCASLQTDFRRETSRRFNEMIAAPGSRIGPDVVSKFIGVSPRTVFRWRDQPDLFIPGYEKCREINAFVDTVRELREAWPVFIRNWKAGLRDFPLSFKRATFPEKLRQVLDDKSLNDSERAELLTVRTLKILSEKLEVEE